MATETISIDIQIEAAKGAKTLGELENSLDEMNKAIREVPRGSKEFDKLSKQIASTSAEVKNLELGFEGLDKEGVASELGSVTGAIGDMTAAFILFGDESETLQEVTKNIEQAIAVSMGLKGAIEGVSSAQKLYNNLVKTGKLQTMLQTAAQKVATAATWLWNAALTANPFMLLLVGLTALTAAIVIFTSSTDENTRAQELNNEARTKAAEAVAEERNKIDELVGTLTRETSSRRDKAAAIAELQDAYPEFLGNIDLETASQEELNTAIQQQIELIELQSRVKALQELRAEQLKKQIKAETEVLTESNETWTSYFMSFGDAELARQVANAQSQEAINLAKEETEVIDGLIASAQKEIDTKTALFDSNQDAEEQAQRIAEGQKKRDEAKAKRDAEAKKKWDANKGFRDAQAFHRRAETESIELESKEVVRIKTEETEALIDLNFQVGDSEEHLAHMRELEHQKLLDRLAEEDAARQEQINKAQAGLDFLNGLNEAFTNDEVKRGKIRKKLAVAQLAIDTARAISSGVASAMAVPFPANIPALLTTMAAVFGNIAQAKALLGSAGSVGGSASISGSSGSIGGGNGISLSPVSNTNTILGEQATQVYVTESDITTTQNKVNVIEQQATFK